MTSIESLAAATRTGPADGPRLRVYLAETDVRIRRQVQRAIEEAGHSVILAGGATRDSSRLRSGEIDPDVFVGSSDLLQAVALAGQQPSGGAALLLARPTDAAFLSGFMRQNPANDIAVLPQPEASLRFCVSNFLLRRQWDRPLRPAMHGAYLFVPKSRQVIFGGKSLTLSPGRFALAHALFNNKDTPLSSRMLYELVWKGGRRDVARLIDANIAMLSHRLELQGAYGYSLVRPFPGSYSLKSVAPEDSALRPALRSGAAARRQTLKSDRAA